MSKPANVLDQFRSYSYHHILVACSNQYTANVLSQQNDLEALQQLGSEHVYTIPAESDNIEGDALGEYIVLINGMRDTRFTVQRATWSTLTAAGVNPTDRGNSIAVEGQLSIQEARGFKFLNEVDRAADAFKTDATGIMYVLKTIFVGHGARQDGTPFTNIIADITPLKFLLINVTGAFTPMGGEYKLEFVGASNGGSRFPQISRAAEDVKFTIESVVLRDVMNQLANRCSALALENRNNIVTKLEEELPDDQKAEAKNLRPVEYKITLEAPYNNDDYRVTDFDPRSTEEGITDSPGTLNFGKSFTVEHAIQHILERCPKVKEDLVKGSDGQRYRYKIFSEITMPDRPATINDSPTTTTDTEKVLVEYRVRRFLELNNAAVEDILGLDANGEPTEPARSGGTEITQQMVQNNLIEFDYYYTGQNLDIKQFDIKLQEGLVFLQTLRSTDNSMTALEQQAGGGMSEEKVVTVTNPVATKPPEQFELRSRTPIFPSTSVKDVRSKNIGDPSDMTTFNAYLSRHAALENIEVEIEIRGNPYLLNQSNRSATEEDNLDNSEEPQTEFNVLTNWDKIPALAKVNIRMPDNSETPSGTNRPDFVDFWYRGFYYVYQIQHNFNEGEFTQKLSMLALPERDVLREKQAQEISTDGETSDTDNAETNLTNTSGDISRSADRSAPRRTSTQTSSQTYSDTIKTGGTARTNVAVQKRANAGEAVSVTKPGRGQD